MGRQEAKRTLNLKDQQKLLTGIVHSVRSSSELDEAPGAYKNIEEVMDLQKDLVKVKRKLLPIAVIKG